MRLSTSFVFSILSSHRYLVCLHFAASNVFGGGVAGADIGVRPTTDLEIFTATVLLVVGALLWAYAFCEAFRCFRRLCRWSDRFSENLDELDYIMAQARLKVR